MHPPGQAASVRRAQQGGALCSSPSGLSTDVPYRKRWSQRRVAARKSCDSIGHSCERLLISAQPTPVKPSVAAAAAAAAAAANAASAAAAAARLAATRVGRRDWQSPRASDVVLCSANNALPPSVAPNLPHGRRRFLRTTIGSTAGEGVSISGERPSSSAGHGNDGTQQLRAALRKHDQLHHGTVPLPDFEMVLRELGYSQAAANGYVSADGERRCSTPWSSAPGVDEHGTRFLSRDSGHGSSSVPLCDYEGWLRSLHAETSGPAASAAACPVVGCRPAGLDSGSCARAANGGPSYFGRVELRPPRASYAHSGNCCNADQAAVIRSPCGASTGACSDSAPNPAAAASRSAFPAHAQERLRASQPVACGNQRPAREGTRGTSRSLRSVPSVVLDDGVRAQRNSNGRCVQDEPPERVRCGQPARPGRSAASHERSFAHPSHAVGRSGTRPCQRAGSAPARDRAALVLRLAAGPPPAAA